jgi:hypothetical protein
MPVALNNPDFAILVNKMLLTDEFLNEKCCDSMRNLCCLKVMLIRYLILSRNTLRIRICYIVI